MEELKRFPILAEDVIKKIDYQSLTKLKEASRDVSEFLDNGRVLWKQMCLKNLEGNYFNLYVWFGLYGGAALTQIIANSWCRISCSPSA